jgi:cytoskeletal protein CcmA (bactofilin family)
MEAAMTHPRFFKIFVSLVLALAISASFVGPALAFDPRSGQEVVIPAGETINDDLYVTAASFTLDGTVKGDLVVFAQTITINGTVEGGLIAAGQTIILNGEVKGSARIAGAALYIGGSAQVGNDLVAAGASLESQGGSQIGRDLVFAGGQALLGGDAARNAWVSTGGLEIKGKVGGNVTTYVGTPGENGQSMGMRNFSNSGIPIPPVPAGLTIDPAARIGGNLEYTSTATLPIPGGVVAGQVIHLKPSPSATELTMARQQNIGQRVLSWFLNLLRSIVVLILLGLLALWLFPRLIKNTAGELQSKPWWSLLWGVVSFPVLVILILTILFVTILLFAIFGLLTLWSLSGLVITLGALVLFVLIFGFILSAAYTVKIVVGDLLGKLILNAVQPDLGKHKVWRLLLGILIVAVLVSLPFIGWLFGIAVLFFGLGALWIASYRRLARTA